MADNMAKEFQFFVSKMALLWFERKPSCSNCLKDCLQALGTLFKRVCEDHHVVKTADMWVRSETLNREAYSKRCPGMDPCDIDKAEALLGNFVSRCEALYGTSFMTFNVHALQHLGNCARSLGPLWAHSAFVFEGGNGGIVRLVSAAHGLPQQITERVIMTQKLHQLLDSSLLSSSEKEKCKALIGYTPLKNALNVCSVTLLGKGKERGLSANEREKLLHSCGISLTQAMEYERFVMKKQVFHSTTYQRASKSDTTFVKTDSGSYKRIEHILFFKEVDLCALFCRPLIIADTAAVPPHVKECFLSPDRDLELLLPRQVIDSCLYINLANEEKTFICDLPNKIERD
ncbi:uncharacterized protein LOC119405813 [Rhipicephalus sanguineus]|uniref:uncharacterized protein LOC119405813 n=1 Tax=Rhipicephalus sanguineus TaxID=34632 RepID=UPI001894E7AF|nr:uncharacterized protein LOC119405813 [Rhipicephalus sanguineus]